MGWFDVTVDGKRHGDSITNVTTAKNTYYKLASENPDSEVELWERDEDGWDCMLSKPKGEVFMNTKCELCGDYFSTSNYHDHLPHCVDKHNGVEVMKTYSGELKDGMPCRVELGASFLWSEGCGMVPAKVYHDNEWKQYEPKPKKVWGIPESGDEYHRIYNTRKCGYIAETYINLDKQSTPNYLCKDTAGQVAKALNVMNKYRMISDVPVDGVRQYNVDCSGEIHSFRKLSSKLDNALFGVVVNEGRQHKLEPWREKVRIANKILQFAWHGNGLVEEQL